MPTWATCRHIVSLNCIWTLSQCVIYKRIRQEKRSTIMYLPLNMQETATKSTNHNQADQKQVSWQSASQANKLQLRLNVAAELTSGSWADKVHLNQAAELTHCNGAELTYHSRVDIVQLSWQTELTDCSSPSFSGAFATECSRGTCRQPCTL